MAWGTVEGASTLVEAGAVVLIVGIVIIMRDEYL